MRGSIALPMDDLHNFCDRHPIRRLALFGSALRADFSPESDVDLLVFVAGGRPVGRPYGG